tara:strand:- start:353 stop:517 length:165 start_codon:yes stop_codon:yes gene_type:complete
MKYGLECVCGYETPLTEIEAEIYKDGRILNFLLAHQEWCDTAKKNELDITTWRG